MELLYSQKGSYHKGSTDSTYYRLNLDYIDVPVMVHFTDKKIISAGLGFCYGQLIDHKESQLFIVTPNGSFLPYDLSAIGEVSLRVWNGLWVNVRYQYTMFSLRTVTFTRSHKCKKYLAERSVQQCSQCSPDLHFQAGDFPISRKNRKRMKIK